MDDPGLSREIYQAIGPPVDRAGGIPDLIEATKNLNQSAEKMSGVGAAIQRAFEGIILRNAHNE